MDNELHQNQIPPPYRQPSHEEINNKFADLLANDIDKDGDGFASEKELRDWIEVVHNKIINDNIEQQWNYYQPDIQEVHSWEGYNPEKKEVLFWEKYVNMTYPDDLHDSDSSDPNYKNMKLMYTRAERRWKGADKNGDGVLVKEEYKDFIHPEESDRTKEILSDEAMEDMDKDDNNEISLEEYMNHLNEMSTDSEKNDPEWVQVQQNHFTTYLDKNKDGVLSKEELKAWLVPDYDRHEAESWKVLSIGDENHDNKLSKEELIKNSQQFMILIPPEFWRQFNSDVTTEATVHDEF